MEWRLRNAIAVAWLQWDSWRKSRWQHSDDDRDSATVTAYFNQCNGRRDSDTCPKNNERIAKKWERRHTRKWCGLFFPSLLSTNHFLLHCHLLSLFFFKMTFQILFPFFLVPTSVSIILKCNERWKLCGGRVKKQVNSSWTDTSLQVQVQNYGRLKLLAVELVNVASNAIAIFKRKSKKEQWAVKSVLTVFVIDRCRMIRCGCAIGPADR